MLTINMQQMGEAVLLDLKGTLLIPGEDEALFEAVSGCVNRGGRLVVLDIGGLARIDAGGLGALVRSRNLLASLDGELRLVNPTGFVGKVLRLTRLDALIPTSRIGPSDLPSGDGERIRASAAAPEGAYWPSASWA